MRIGGNDDIILMDRVNFFRITGNETVSILKTYIIRFMYEDRMSFYDPSNRIIKGQTIAYEIPETFMLAFDIDHCESISTEDNRPTYGFSAYVHLLISFEKIGNIHSWVVNQ
ncbi:MAG: hypothetical protein EBV19_09665 [Flavobacteriia bacterium]|nr:hypothetical protein [Flavobacteriia bacterium]